MATFFDKLAPIWDNSPHEYDKREEIVSMMRLPPHSVIVDAGCGKGIMFEHLLKTNPDKIIAVDISGEMLRLAKKLFKSSRIEFIHDDFLSATLPILDAVVIFNSYPHFLDKKTLAEKLASSLKKNGILIIAHSRSKVEVNSIHNRNSVSNLSVHLEAAAAEAKKFYNFFTPDVLIDSDAIYFIRMLKI